MLQEQSWIVARKTIWSTKLKLLSCGPLLKNISDFHLKQYCYSYLYIRFPWGAFNNPMPYTFQPQSLEVQLRHKYYSKLLRWPNAQPRRRFTAVEPISAPEFPILSISVTILPRQSYLSLVLFSLPFLIAHLIYYPVLLCSGQKVFLIYLFLSTQALTIFQQFQYLFLSLFLLCLILLMVPRGLLLK